MKPSVPIGSLDTSLALWFGLWVPLLAEHGQHVNGSLGVAGVKEVRCLFPTAPGLRRVGLASRSGPRANDCAS